MKLKITIPEGLKDIKLYQYQKFAEIEEKIEDANTLAIQMVHIFCNVEIEKVRLLNIQDVFSIGDTIGAFFNEKPPLINRFTMNGVQYGFIPKLDEMTFGEYVDIDTYLSDWQNMQYAMAVLYRPVEGSYKDMYNIRPYKTNDEAKMLEMPMDVVLGALLFFYRLGNDCSRTIANYLQEKQESSLVKYINSEKSMAGLAAYTDSLKAILDDLKVSLN